MDAIRAEYDRIAREGLPPDELDGGKQQLKGQIMLALESPMAPDGPAGGLQRCTTIRTARSTEMLAEIDAVTADDVCCRGGGVLPVRPADRCSTWPSQPSSHPERSEGDHVRSMIPLQLRSA